MPKPPARFRSGGRQAEACEFLAVELDDAVEHRVVADGRGERAGDQPVDVGIGVGFAQRRQHGHGPGHVPQRGGAHDQNSAVGLPGLIRGRGRGVCPVTLWL
ncbi:MAG: hypothetical protein R3C45_17115 [Phycisphaerales bacterium]